MPGVLFLVLFVAVQGAGCFIFQCVPCAYDCALRFFSIFQCLLIFLVPLIVLLGVFLFFMFGCFFCAPDCAFRGVVVSHFPVLFLCFRLRLSVCFSIFQCFFFFVLLIVFFGVVCSRSGAVFCVSDCAGVIKLSVGVPTIAFFGAFVAWMFYAIPLSDCCSARAGTNVICIDLSVCLCYNCYAPPTTWGCKMSCPPGLLAKSLCSAQPPAVPCGATPKCPCSAPSSKCPCGAQHPNVPAVPPVSF